MIKNRKIAMGCLALALVISGCSNQNSTNAGDKTSESQIIVNKSFEKDSNTVRDGEESKYITKQSGDKVTNRQEIENSKTPDSVGEIILENNDNTQVFTVDQDDVIYNGTRYKNLYTNIQMLNSRYDKNTLINFIITQYNTNSSIIYTIMTVDKQSLAEDIIDENSEDVDITIDEDLSFSDNYIKTRDKYNEPAQWMLTIRDNEQHKETWIAGAYSYIIVNNLGEDRVIDMSTIEREQEQSENIDEAINEETETVENEDTSIDETEASNAEEDTNTVENIEEQVNEKQ